MTVEIELNENQAEQLVQVLSENETAVGKTNSVRWTEDSAAQIEQLRETVADQI